MARLDVRAGLILLLAGLSSHVAAGSSGFSYPRPHETVAGNAPVAVSWTLPPSLDADEMELVLSLDGGETFPVRVTKELEPTAQGVLWRVPALPTGHARLALRAGSKHRETLLFLSPEFTIVPDAVSRLEEVVEVRGELHTKDAVEAREASTLPEGGVHSAGERITAAFFEEAADDSGSFLLPLQPLVPGPLVGEASAQLSSSPAPRLGARISLPKRE